MDKIKFVTSSDPSNKHVCPECLVSVQSQRVPRTRARGDHNINCDDDHPLTTLLPIILVTDNAGGYSFIEIFTLDPIRQREIEFAR